MDLNFFLLIRCFPEAKDSGLNGSSAAGLLFSTNCHLVLMLLFFACVNKCDR